MANLSDEEFLEILKTRCVGLTGSIATGKSTVADLIHKEGFHVYDADIFAKQMVTPGSETLTKIVEAFGPTVLSNDGSLNRSILRQKVMNDSNARAILESITHPAIHRAFKNEVEKYELTNQKVFFYEAALLYETSRDKLFKEVWATTCTENTQIERIMNRNRWSKQEAKQIIDQQMPAFTKAQKASHVIDTECSLEVLRTRISHLLANFR